MAIRKSMSEEIVVSGDRDEWLQKCATALEVASFTKVTTNSVTNQITANYKKFTTWGEITISLAPIDGDTKITAVSTSNVDNIYALFKSPNKTILSKFKENLK